MGFPKRINCETFFQLCYMRFLGYKFIGMRFWGFNFKDRVEIEVLGWGLKPKVLVSIF